MKPKILFFAPFGLFQVHHQLDAVVATALRIRGADCAVLTCDGVYKDCDVLAWSGENAQRDCLNCAASGQKLFSAFQLPMFQLRNLVSPQELQMFQSWVEQLDPEQYMEATYNGLSIGSWVTSSVFGTFRITFNRLRDRQVQQVHKNYIYNALLTWTALDRLVKQYEFTNFVVFNGRYAPYRVALEYGKKNNIPVVIHERGYVDDTFVLYKDRNIAETEPFFTGYKLWQDTPLSKEEVEFVHQNFIAREQGKDTNFTPFVSCRTEYKEVRHKLRIPPEAKILSVFTSSEYELAMSDDFRTAVTQTEAIKTLIELFRSRDEYLVIRHHPYLAGDPASPPDTEFLEGIFESMETLPPNVRVILPSEKLNTYALIWSSDAAIAFISTAGAESLARGIPAASFPQSIYRDVMSCQISDCSRLGFENLVNNLLRMNEQFCIEDLKRVYRLQYMIVGRFSFKFSSFGIREIFQPDIRFSQLKDIEPGADRTMDRLCDHILYGSHLMPHPSSENQKRDGAEEIQFLRECMKNIHHQRKVIRQESIDYLSQQVVEEVTLIPLQHEPDDRTLRQSIRASRHTRMRVSEPIDLKGLKETILTIVDRLSEVPSKYVSFLDDRVSHTEAFLSDAEDLLAKNPDVIGARSGGWYIRKGSLQHGLFCERVPCNTYAEAIAVCPLLSCFSIQLSFAVFRTKHVEELLKQLSLSSEERISEQLFDWLTSNEIMKIDSQLVLLTER